ncbi:MAG: hypothetical protein FWF81_03420 [Defluviitaleaceae bacterium]|nr:hypothetical protein [Defluviitaleaceae bacterium]
MTSQIEQLRANFGRLNTAQKKQFIDNLKQKIQGKNNPEYAKFLNECIQSYNADIRRGLQESQNNPSAATVFENKTVYKRRNPLKGIAIMLGVLLVVAVAGISVLIVAINDTNTTNDTNTLVGRWRGTGVFEALELNRNGTGTVSTFREGVEDIAWRIQDGQLIIVTQTESSLEFDISYSTLRFRGWDVTGRYAYSVIYERIEGSHDTNSPLLGTWQEEWGVGTTWGTILTFYRNETGVERRQFGDRYEKTTFSWSIVDEKLMRVLHHENFFEYAIQGSTLTLFGEQGGRIELSRVNQ